MAALRPFIYDVALLLADQGGQPKVWARKLLPAALADLEQLGSIQVCEDNISIQANLEPSVQPLQQLQREILTLGDPVAVGNVVRRMRSKHPRWGEQTAAELVSHGLLEKQENSFLFLIKETRYTLTPAGKAAVDQFKAEIGQVAEQVRAGVVPNAPSLMPLYLLGGLGLLGLALPATVTFGANDVMGSLISLRDQLDPDAYGFAFWRKQPVAAGADASIYWTESSYDFG